MLNGSAARPSVRLWGQLSARPSVRQWGQLSARLSVRQWGQLSAQAPPVSRSGTECDYWGMAVGAGAAAVRQGAHTRPALTWPVPVPHENGADLTQDSFLWRE